MQCPECDGKATKFGKTRDGQQRYRCKECKKSFSEPKPLAGKQTSTEKACFALSLLLEGMSIRATERLTGLHRDTILGIMVQAGQQCEQFMVDAVVNEPFRDVQVDEQWAFVFCKEKTAVAKGHGYEAGDSYVFTAIDRESKFLICHHVGKRDSDHTWTFTEKLYRCISGRPQISTDGFGPYRSAIKLTWRHQCDHGMIIKAYGNTSKEGQRRYSPAKIISIKKEAVCGEPVKEQVCTSHIERHNLSTRMHLRRFTRLTNGHSKKWENHEAMLALYFAWYNWCRKHDTLKTTPAVAAGLAEKPWSLEKLLKESVGE